MLILLLIYVFYLVELGIPLFVIAQKSAHPLAWTAFVPIVSFYLMCDMADAELWWFALLLIPYLNIIFAILLWTRIAENTNKPSWLGMLMILPVISIFVAYYMAFIEPDRIIG